MHVLKRALEIDAPATEVWRVLTTPELIREWASAYLDGIQIRTSFREGESVTWKTSNGTTTSEGTVAACKPERLLRFEYESDPRGTFSETYEIVTLIEANDIVACEILWRGVLAVSLRSLKPGIKPPALP